MDLTDSQWFAVTEALRFKAEADVALARSEDREKQSPAFRALADQLIRQATASMALADYIEENY